MHRAEGHPSAPAALRRGAALLEALVALALLGTAGVALLTMSHETGSAVERAASASEDIARASALLDAVSLWPRADLDRHLGVRPQGAWHLHVQRPAPTLYLIALTDTTDRQVLLETALFRPEPPRSGFDAAR